MESGCKISYFSHEFPTPATRTLSVRISYAAFYWVKFNKYKHKKNKWISKGIIKSIEIKDKLYKLMIQHTIDDVEAHQYIKNTFNIYRNMLKKLIRQAKRLYYTCIATFARFKHNIKQTWKIIKETLNRSKRDALPNRFLVGEQYIDDPKEIANAFNSYFINIGPSVASHIVTVTDVFI